MEKPAQPRSVAKGREVFTAAACIACHRYANEGGEIGPDLNAVAYKLGAREMAESMIEPSKVIADQFQNTIVELANGETRTGRILKKSKDRIVISLNPLPATTKKSEERYPQHEGVASFAHARGTPQQLYRRRHSRSARLPRLWWVVNRLFPAACARLSVLHGWENGYSPGMTNDPSW